MRPASYTRGLRLCRLVGPGHGVFHKVLISDSYFGFPALAPRAGGGQEQRQRHKLGARWVIQVRDRWEHLEGGLS